MKKLKLPFFFVRLVWQNALNFLQLVVFYLSASKLSAANALLTLVAISLGVSWALIPFPQAAVPPEIRLDIEENTATTPLYFTWTEADIQQQFLQYQERIEQQDFVSQAEYVNLAILAHDAGEYELADQYLELARYIDPNRDFFVE